MSTSNEEVLQAVKNTIESIIKVGSAANDPLSEDTDGKLVARKLKDFLTESRTLATTASQMKDVQIPLDILAYIDDGRNPDIYSREFAELITKQNQSIAGTASALALFEQFLREEMQNQNQNQNQN